MVRFELPELTQLVDKVDLLLNRVEDIGHHRLPEWVDLRTACEYKGVNYETVRDRPDLQPDRSKRKKVSGKWMWPRDVIIDWSKKTDDDLGYSQNRNIPS